MSHFTTRVQAPYRAKSENIAFHMNTEVFA